MNTTRHILIDPATRTVSEVRTEGTLSLQDTYELLQAVGIESLYLPGAEPDACLVGTWAGVPDSELSRWAEVRGLWSFSSPEQAFPVVAAGRALISGPETYDEAAGDYVTHDTTHTAEEIAGLIHWATVDDWRKYCAQAARA